MKAARSVDRHSCVTAAVNVEKLATENQVEGLHRIFDFGCFGNTLRLWSNVIGYTDNDNAGARQLIDLSLNFRLRH